MISFRPHQPIGIQHLLDHPRCALFAPMGSGKSLMALTALRARMLADVDRVLVVGPLRVARGVWPAEVREWYPDMTCEFVGGAGREIPGKVTLSTAQINTINFDQLPVLIDHFVDPDTGELRPGRKWPYQVIVVDESSRLRGYRTKQGTVRTRKLMQVAFLSRYMIELTGTPSPNGLEQLWGQMAFLDNGVRLGKSFEAFKNRWFMSAPGADGYQQIVALPNADREIHERIADLCLSIDLGKYMDLKAPVIHDVYVDLPSDVRKQYRKMARDFFAELGTHKIEAFSAAAKSNKLLQLSNGAVYHDKDGNWAWAHDAKIEALESIVEEANGAPVLVAYNFRTDVERILGRFSGTARKLDSDHDIVDWNAGKIPIGVIHPASAGHGLNLQHGGNILVYFGLTWDLELYAQTMERIGPARQAQSGYNRPVYIYRILGRDTIDDVVKTRLETKRGVQDCLMEAMRRDA